MSSKLTETRLIALVREEVASFESGIKIVKARLEKAETLASELREHLRCLELRRDCLALYLQMREANGYAHEHFRALCQLQEADASSEIPF